MARKPTLTRPSPFWTAGAGRPPCGGGGGLAAAGPALLLIPLTLGPGRALTPAYVAPLAAALALPSSAGALGGRPGASLFFVGVAAGGDAPSLLYLDPHDARPAAAPLAHWCDACPPRALRADGVDPSLALAFWCASPADAAALADGLAAIEAAHPGAPLVCVRDGDGAAEKAVGMRGGNGGGGGEEDESGFELL